MDAPNGFRLDPKSGLYYCEKQSKDSATGAPVRLVTWFDPKTGISKQASYPAPQPKPIAPKASAPAPAPAASAAPESASPVPDGFVLDSQSKLYYRSEKGVDGAGNPVQRVTYYDPSKRTYHPVHYPIAQVSTQEQTPAAQGAQLLQAPAEPQPDFSDISSIPGQAPYQPLATKKNIIPIVSVCAAVLLVVTIGLCAWQFEWFGDGFSLITTAGDTAWDDGGSEVKSFIPLAKSYEYSDIESVYAIQLKFSSKTKFTLTYNHDGKSQTVKGTYKKIDRKGFYTIEISSDDSAPGWNGSSTFLQQLDGDMFCAGSEDISDYTGCRLKPT